MRPAFLALALLMVAPSAIAQPLPYFEPADAGDVHTLFQMNGYTVEDEGAWQTWISSPGGTRLQLGVFTNPDGSVAGLRTTGWYYVGTSQAAIDAARNYERTNPMASVAVMTSDGGEYFIAVIRDIRLGSGRTAVNVLSQVELQIRLLPLFQQSLAQSDPAVAAIFAGASEETE